jgi:RNA methyltransferase, TrmH family
MLTKSGAKFIKSLQVKKYRKQEQCFLIEGAKSVQELLVSDFELVTLLGTADFLRSIKKLPSVEIIETTEKELQGLGEFQSNNAALAVAKMKPNLSFNVEKNEYALILDDIRDPGNLGTIIRTADWYGVNKIIASTETSDFYNSKVITSTMGSFTRVSIFYTELTDYLSNIQQKVYGAYLDGQDIHALTFAPGGFIVIGNESRGISSELERYVTDKITIPRFGKAESLNAGIATAVVLDNLRRGKS